MKFLCFEIKYFPTRNPIFKKRNLRKIILREWVGTNNMIKAIKKHRELTGSSLKDAKAFCDDLQEIAMIELSKKR